jgi:hypothetical protein
MEKRAHRYRVTLEYLQTAKGESVDKKPIQVEFTNHDDIFSIVERLQQKDPFKNKNEDTEFAIGLKMFSEVMIRNRKHPLFEELAPAFSEFMKKLKALPDDGEILA